MPSLLGLEHGVCPSGEVRGRCWEVGKCLQLQNKSSFPQHEPRVLRAEISQSRKEQKEREGST